MKTVLQVLEATEGGTRRHLRDLVGGLDPAEFRCALAVACRRDPDFQNDLTAWCANGLDVTELAMQRGLSPLADLAALAGLIRCVRRVRPDLIHAHSAKAGALARAAGCLCRVPVVYTPHAFPFLMACGPRRRGFYRWVERLACRETATIIAVSSEEEAAALALGYPRACGTHPQWCRTRGWQTSSTTRPRADRFHGAAGAEGTGYPVGGDARWPFVCRM